MSAVHNLAFLDPCWLEDCSGLKRNIEEGWYFGVYLSSPVLRFWEMFIKWALWFADACNSVELRGTQISNAKMLYV